MKTVHTEELPEVLKRLQGGLIVSCQPRAPLNTPAYVAALASAVVEAGAVALRIEGAERIAAVRAAVDVPILGILKRRVEGVPAYITATRDDVNSVLDAGADVVALDGRNVAHLDGSTVPELVARAHERGTLVMADVSTLEEGRYAADAGADVVASTLSGYTEASPPGPDPDLELVAALAREAGRPVVAEGRLHTPEAVRAAFARGAFACVVGTAITEPRFLVQRFRAATFAGGAEAPGHG